MNRSVGREGRSETLPDESGRQGWPLLALHLIAPASFFVAALVLPAFMLNTTRPFRGSGLGPAAWPQVMLALIAVCAAIWFVQEFLAWRRGRAAPLAAESAPPGEKYSYIKAVTGLVMIAAYGWLLPVVGFPIATASFVALWCILGGVRKPVAVIPLSLIGTGALLWVFMGLALMPLSRGQGIFDRISIAILQMLGIY